MSQTADREEMIDFSEPIFDIIGISVLMQKPKLPQNFQFARVLEAMVWPFLIVAYILSSTLIAIFDKLKTKVSRNEKKERYLTFNESLWLCFGILTSQGSSKSPKNLPGRIVVTVWWLFSFMLVAAYAAHVACIFIVSRAEVPIESFSKLSNQFKVRFAPIKGTSTENFFYKLKETENKFAE